MEDNIFHGNKSQRLPFGDDMGLIRGRDGSSDSFMPRWRSDRSQSHRFRQDRLPGPPSSFETKTCVLCIIIAVEGNALRSLYHSGCLSRLSLSPLQDRLCFAYALRCSFTGR
jgi:hypothetical protein